MKQAPPESASVEAEYPLLDFPLWAAILLALMAWADGFFWSTLFGPWWSLIWLGPALYIARRLWKSELPRGRLWAALPLLVVVLAGVLEVALGQSRSVPWCTTHVLVAAAVIAAAAAARRRAETAWFARRVGILGLVVLPLPWLPIGAAQGFWMKCTRLRLGMRVEEVAELFSDNYVQDPTKEDPCECLPVRAGQAASWLQQSRVVFCPSDGDHEKHCSADGFWAEFEDGRLVGGWISPD